MLAAIAVMFATAGGQVIDPSEIQRWPLAEVAPVRVDPEQVHKTLSHVGPSDEAPEAQGPAGKAVAIVAVACPAEQQSQMDKAEYEQAIAAYKGDIDPLPPGTKERPLPIPRFRRAADQDKDFPLSVRATAVLLQNEDGKIDQVLVPCANHAKAIEPIRAAMAKAKLAKSTRQGAPAKAMVVVPVEWGL